MSEPTTSQVGCPNCGIQYRWKPELSSKKILCPCGCKFRMPPTPTGRPTTISLPAKGAGALNSSGGWSTQGLEKDPKSGSKFTPGDALGHLTRLNQLDDITTGMENEEEATANPGGNAEEAVAPAQTPPRHSFHPGVQQSADGRLELDLDDPLDATNPGVSDPPAHAARHDPAPAAQTPPANTTDDELELDLSPVESLVPAEPAAQTLQHSPPIPGAKTFSERVSRAEKRQQEAQEDSSNRYLLTDFVVPLACVIIGILLAMCDAWYMGPKVDMMNYDLARETELAQKQSITGMQLGGMGMFGFGMPPPPPDAPSKEISADNLAPIPSSETQVMVGPGEKKVIPLPESLRGGRDEHQEALLREFRLRKDGGENLIRRSIRTVVMAVLSIVCGFMGLLLCVKLLGSAFEGLLSILLKLLAIMLIVNGAMDCLNSYLDLLTEGFAGLGISVVLLLGLGLFYTLCAALLEMDWIETIIMFGCCYIVPYVASGAFVILLVVLIQ